MNLEESIQKGINNIYSNIKGQDGIPNWELNNYGCGPCAIATILSSIGYNFNPVDVAKLMFLDEYENLLDFYTNKENGRLGMSTLGFWYLLQELVRSKKAYIKY